MEDDDLALMAVAVEAAATVRSSTAPNPWVGAALRTVDGRVFVGATSPPGGPHAEVAALAAARTAGADTHGGLLASTLEPCHHQGRTGPCTARIVAAGVARVLVGVEDPDPLVRGRGVSALREAGLEVVTGVQRDVVVAQLEPYLHHRRSGRPWVVLKLAATLDGRTAAPDGSSRWITDEPARRDAHRLRAESQAIIVGAGTVRADDPELTTRLVDGADPVRVVLGRAPAAARVHPCREWTGSIEALLDDLGREGVLQVLVEGGARVARSFHSAGLVDQYVVYIAPALLGGDDAPGLFSGPGAPTMAALRRGRFSAVDRLGDDLRLEVRLTTGRTEVGDQPGR